MSNWTRTRHDPSRSYTDEEKRERKQGMLGRIQDFVEGGLEAEEGLVKAAKEADPETPKEKLKQLITRFRDAVYVTQQRDRLPR